MNTKHSYIFNILDNELLKFTYKYLSKFIFFYGRILCYVNNEYVCVEHGELQGGLKLLFCGFYFVHHSFD